jgi:hypothetical protein
VSCTGVLEIFSSDLNCLLPSPGAEGLTQIPQMAQTHATSHATADMPEREKEKKEKGPTHHVRLSLAMVLLGKLSLGVVDGESG